MVLVIPILPSRYSYDFAEACAERSCLSSNLKLTPAAISSTSDFNVTVTVQNTGEMDGKEVVQVYVTDLISSVVTPNQFLAGFEKVDIPYVISLPRPELLTESIYYRVRESREVSIQIKAEQLAVWALTNQLVVEPGQFNIKVGTSDLTYANATLTVQ